jgi:MFS family permease
MFAAIVGILLVSKLAPGTMAMWGWRVPLWIGCAVIPFLFWIRNSLAETAEFAARRRHPAMREILSSLWRNWRIVVIGTMLTALTTTAFYLITAYTPTFGARTLHLSRSNAFLVTFCVGICNFTVLPIMGLLSDKIGRRPLLWICTVTVLATAYPVMLWLTASPSFTRLLIAELWFSILYASYNGAMVVYLTEIMPVNVRATGFSLAYSFATALFGGFTPFISEYLIHATGNRAVPGAWLSAAALLALVAVGLAGRQVTLAAPDSAEEAELRPVAAGQV